MNHKNDLNDFEPETARKFANGVVHEFNNVLTEIMGNITLAKFHGNPDTSQVQFLKKAEDACMRAASLARKMQQLQEKNLSREPYFSTREVITEAVEFVFSGSEYRCRFFLPDDLEPVAVKVGQLVKVLNRVVLNIGRVIAAEYSLYIKAENCRSAGGLLPGAGEGPYVQVAIRLRKHDASEGVFPGFSNAYRPEQNLEWEFGKRDDERKMKQYEDIIVVEADSGNGFDVYLPAFQHTCRSKKPEMSLTTGSGKQILVVDDELDIQMLMSGMLAKLGYRSSLAKNGDEAIQLYQTAWGKAKPFHVVIIDLIIPGMIKGEEILQKLKEINPAVKAIISSGYASSPVMRGFKEYGFKGAIVKPFCLEQLDHILQNVISEKIPPSP